MAVGSQAAMTKIAATGSGASVLTNFIFQAGVGGGLIIGIVAYHLIVPGLIVLVNNRGLIGSPTAGRLRVIILHWRSVNLCVCKNH